MAILTEEAIEAAEARGRDMLVTAPRAATARFDPATRAIAIDLVNGCTYSFPAARVQDPQQASDADLAGVQVDGAGLNLHWPALDVALLVPALLAGRFGTRAWMAREFARSAGQAGSPAKASAARRNGGRPRKLATAGAAG